MANDSPSGGEVSSSPGTTVDRLAINSVRVSDLGPSTGVRLPFPAPWMIYSIDPWSNVRATGRMHPLEVVANGRLVFTGTLLPGVRPGPAPFMSGIISLEPGRGRTQHVARALHGDAE